MFSYCSRFTMLPSSCAACCKPMLWEPWAWEAPSPLMRTDFALQVLVFSPSWHLPRLVSPFICPLCIEAGVVEDALGPSSRKRSHTAIRDWGPQAPCQTSHRCVALLVRIGGSDGFPGVAMGRRALGPRNCLATCGGAPREAASLGG